MSKESGSHTHKNQSTQRSIFEFYSCPPSPRLRRTLLCDNCSACVACHSDRVADAKCGCAVRAVLEPNWRRFGERLNR